MHSLLLVAVLSRRLAGMPEGGINAPATAADADQQQTDRAEQEITILMPSGTSWCWGSSDSLRENARAFRP